MTMSGRRGIVIVESNQKETVMSNVETRNEKLDLRVTPSAKRSLQIAALCNSETQVDLIGVALRRG